MASVTRFDEWQDTSGTPVLRFAANTLEVWDGAAWQQAGAVRTDYLVIGGGGGSWNSGAIQGAGGAGAGGYRCNVSGESSGGGALAEPIFSLAPGTYPLQVGAGGAVNTNGSPTFFGIIFSAGGGRGGNQTGPTAASGGSGGGGEYIVPAGGAGTVKQGFAGGTGGITSGGNTNGGGGGGAGSVGGNQSANTAGNGGAGVTSSITGSAVGRAGGGGGGNQSQTLGGTATDGGGRGQAAGVTPAENGTANTGGGAGGGSVAGQTGGSGVVIFRVPTGTSVSFSGGVSQTSATVGDKTVYTVTAAGPTDTFTIG